MARRPFLERQTYRRNRLQDAARLLPVLGAVLIFSPLFIRGTDTIAPDGAEGTGTPEWLVYYFVIWLGLIVLTAAVSGALMRSDNSDTPPGQTTPDGPAGRT